MYFINFNILYLHIHYNVLTFYNDIYTATPEDWNLSLPIQMTLQF